MQPAFSTAAAGGAAEGCGGITGGSGVVGGAGELRPVGHRAGRRRAPTWFKGTMLP